MITGRCCGKRWHSKDECHIKHRESQKHKKMAVEKRKQAGKANPEW